MDQVKMFLRYETSGAIYFIWLILFYISLNSQANGSSFIVQKLIEEKVNLPWGGFILAFPIGVIIHQISVNLKNTVVCEKYKYLNDSPDKNPTLAILNRLNIIDAVQPTVRYRNKREKTFEYVRDRISNLNSFYYARIDNGIIAPFFAWCSAVVLRGYSEKTACYELSQHNVDLCRTSLLIVIVLLLFVIFLFFKAFKMAALKSSVFILIIIYGYSLFQLYHVVTNCLFTLFTLAAIFIGVMMSSYVSKINKEIEIYCGRI